MSPCIAILTASCLAFGAPGATSPFATEVVSTVGAFGPSPYDDPAAVLGKPATEVDDPGAPPFTPPGVFTTSLALAAAWTDTAGNELVTTLNAGDEIVVKFDHPVLDHPDNWYGRDFIVYGNAFFIGSGTLRPDTNMASYMLTGGGIGEGVTVSVSSDGASWYTYSAGPSADNPFPTNPFAWDAAAGTWGEELDWTKPVPPDVTTADLIGLPAAAAIGRYEGSAGGTSYDLAEATGLDTMAVTLPDGQSVQSKYIRYVKVHDSLGGEIDGFSDVAVMPIVGDFDADGDLDADDVDALAAAIREPSPDPRFDLTADGQVDAADADTWVRDIRNTEYGDVTLDGRVDGADLSLMAANWLAAGEGWATGDLTGDGQVDGADLSLTAANWLFDREAPTPVPEPAAAVLFLLAAVAARATRRARTLP